MNRLTFSLVALCGLLAGALGWSFVAPRDGVDETAIRAVVEDVLAAQSPGAPATEIAALDPALLNPMIESYLMANPRVMERVATALDAENARIKAEETRVALAASEEALYNDPDHVVLGNPEGDVTLVELFDYNCVYCRGAVPDMATLLAEDPNLKVILKEFPILSAGSEEAARVAVAVNRTDVDYWAFHEALFTSRGQVTGDVALDVAADLGLNRVDVALEAASGEVGAALERSHALARALNVAGTPTYIIGDEIIPSAVGVDVLREKIANMRACGKTVCAG